MYEKNYELKDMITAEYGKETALAARLGWTRQRLNKITTGRKMPDIEELNDLAGALHKPINEMILIFLPQKSPNEQQKQ